VRVGCYRGATILGAVLILVAALLVGCGSGGGSGSDGNMAPDFSGTTLDGVEASLSDYRGKPLLLVFMASWCGPCLAEAPEIEAFYRKEAGRAEVLALAVWDSSESDLRQFRAAGGHTYPVMMAADELADLYHVRSVPTLFVIDAEGRIVETLVGGGRSSAEFSALMDDLTP
jgi:thiol-disulfide isomerase/thioredoxin